MEWCEELGKFETKRSTDVEGLRTRYGSTLQAPTSSFFIHVMLLFFMHLIQFYLYEARKSLGDDYSIGMESIRQSNHFQDYFNFWIMVSLQELGAKRLLLLFYLCRIFFVFVPKLLWSGCCVFSAHFFFLGENTCIIVMHMVYDNFSCWYNCVCYASVMWLCFVWCIRMIYLQVFIFYMLQSRLGKNIEFVVFMVKINIRPDA